MNLVLRVTIKRSVSCTIICSRWIIQYSRILLSKIFTPCLTFFIPFVIIMAKFWKWIHRIFKPCLAAILIFLQPVICHMTNMNNLEQIGASARIQQYTSSEEFDTYAWITNSNLQYLIFLAPRYQIKENCQEESCSSGKYAKY